MTQWAQSLGHPMSSFTDPAEALAAFRDAPREFDLVLTNMSMPGGSGLEFAQQVLSIEPKAMVVIATGCEDPNWADYARASGVHDVIEKPTTLDEMAAVLERLLLGADPA